MTRTILVLILGGVLMTTSTSQAQTEGTGQDAGDNESDPIVEALERQKKIAELEKAIAEAEKAKLAAELPDTEASGITGSVTFNKDSGYFAEMLAYQSMLGAAVLIGSALGPPETAGTKVIVVTGDELAKSAQLWEIANVRVEDAKKRLEDLLEKYPTDYDFAVREAVAPVLTTATALLSAAADIASFLRSELTVSAANVNVTTTALIAATAAKLKSKGWAPVLPASSLKKTALLGNIEALLAARRNLASRRADLESTMQPKLLELANLELELEKAKAAYEAAKKAGPADPDVIKAAEGKVRELQSKILPLGIMKGRWEKAVTEIDTTLAATDALVKALVEGAEGKPSAVEVVAAVDVAKSDSTLKILQLETSSQGGETHVSKSAWRTRLTYVGGVAVSYLLMDQEGTVEKSGVVAQPIAKSTRAKSASSDLKFP